METLFVRDTLALDSALTVAHTAVVALEEHAQRASVFTVKVLAGVELSREDWGEWLTSLAALHLEAARLRAELPTAAPCVHLV